MKKVLIVGAGISGCSAATALAESGHEVLMVDRESVAGGKVLDYCCKATDSCSRCGVCVAHTEIRDALKDPRITFTSGFSIDTVSQTQQKITVQGSRKNPGIDYRLCSACNSCVEACPEKCITPYRRGELVQYHIDYSKCRLHNGQHCDICMKACDTGAITGESDTTRYTFTAAETVIATGHTPFNAGDKPRYGYLRSDRVITGAEAESRLSTDMELGDAKDVAFIQCVGSRDPVLGRNYCSAVCCSYALRLARILKSRQPDVNVTIYYIDIQNFDKEYNRLRSEIEEMGVRFHRGVPFLIEEASDGKLKFMIESDDDQESVVHHDMAVLSVGMGPDPDSLQLAELFGLRQDRYGFFTGSADSEGTGHIHMCGTCREPQSMPSSMADAQAAAWEIAKADNVKSGAAGNTR